MSDNTGLLQSDMNLSSIYIPNEGQINEVVKYYTKGNGNRIFFTNEEIVFMFKENEEVQPYGRENHLMKQRLDPIQNVLKEYRYFSFSLQFMNAANNAIIEGQEKQQGKVNYLKGDKQYKNLPTYQEVIYRNIWSGIDVVFRGENRKIKYEFILQPGANPKDIRLKYKGIDNLSIDAEGNLQIETPLGIFNDELPISYQIINGEKIYIETRHVLEQGENGAYINGFEVSEYDSHYPLIIDPSLDYSTYLGGTDFDTGASIAVDTSGNAYVTGVTLSMDFPTENPFQSTFGGVFDAFVTKLSSDGSIIYSTYLGGNDIDQGLAIAVDTAGSAYVAGQTFSDDFPMMNPFQEDIAGDFDGFVTKLSPDGSSLIYSTYLGGSNSDHVISITVDAAGNAYMTGVTRSTDFPTRNPFQAASGGDLDAFVTKLSPDGSSLIYSTYLGGSNLERGAGIAVDVMGNAYVVGETESINFPTKRPVQRTFAGETDGFVTKLSPDGSSLIYSTYLGGGNYDDAAAIAVDAEGNAFVTGSTGSTNFPTKNPLQAELREFDAYVTKLNRNGCLIFSTYLGGSGSDGGFGIAVDSLGNPYVTGFVGSTDFPTKDPIQAELAGEFNAFVTKLNGDGSSLIYSTYFGGSIDDFGNDIAVDAIGNAYVVGNARSSDFPTKNAIQAELLGEADAFVFKILTPLTILCPNNITVVNDIGRNGAFVHFPHPTVFSNSPFTTVCTPNSGSFFRAGNNTVVCTVTDASGKTKTCRFNIRVVIDPCRYFGRNCC